jgi:hypothetical protein
MSRKGQPVFRSATFVAILLAISPCVAQASCYAPSAPYCAARYGSFDDQDEFEQCRHQMTAYQSEAQEFLACIRRESEDLKRKSDSVIDEYNGAVEAFNRRARG